MPNPTVNIDDPEIQRAIAEGARLIQQTADNYERVKLEPIMLENGARYHGEWVNAARDGQGHQKWPDGSEYNGQ